jgi:hypothetical protein
VQPGKVIYAEIGEKNTDKTDETKDGDFLSFPSPDET